MRYQQEAPATATDVERSCRKFLDQARVVLPLDALTVVLLDRQEDTGRVVFSWKSPSPIKSPHGRKGLSDLPHEPQPCAELNVTMHGSEGPIGSVLFHSCASHEFNPLERRLARDISGQLAVRLENILIHQQVQITSGEIALLGEVARIVASSPQLGELLDRLAAALDESLSFAFAILSWIDANNYDIHTLQSASGSPQAESFSLTTPIIYNKKVIGALSLYRSDRPFSRAARELLDLVGGQTAQAIHHARSHHSASAATSQPHPGQRQTSLAFPDQQRASNGSAIEPNARGDMVHALCSPLTAIKGYASSLLQSDADWPPEIQREFLKTIDQAADHLNQVIRDLLLGETDDSPDAGRQHAISDFQTLFDSVKDELSSSPVADRVRFHCAPGLPPVWIAPHLIKQVIKHLVDTLLAMAGPEGMLRIEARAGNDRPFISVGLSNEGHHSFRLEPSSMTTWDGDLRVAVCRNILEAHGAALDVEATPAGGIQFQFPLPIAPTFG